jgi:transposase-like protein
MIVSERSPLIPAAKPPEFRRRAVELARLREQPIRKIALDLGISESCLRRWMDQADVDQGVKEGPAEPDEQGSGITAPFNAPSQGPPPWNVYRIEPRSATVVSTTEPGGLTRFRF